MTILRGPGLFFLLLACPLAQATSLFTSPARQNIKVGELFQVEIVLASDEPLLGGFFDVAYDTNSVAFIGYAYGDLGDPDFNAPPATSPGLLAGFSVGSFGGIFTGTAVTLTFRLTAAGTTVIDLIPALWLAGGIGIPFEIDSVDGMVGSPDVTFAVAAYSVDAAAGPIGAFQSVDFEAELFSVGSAPLEVLAVELTDSAREFLISADECTGRVLEAGEECSVFVRATPRNLSPSGYQFTQVDFITSDVLDQVPNTKLTVLTFTPGLDPSPVDFVEVPLRPPYPTQIMTVVNDGSWAADFKSLRLARSSDDASRISVVAETCTGAHVAVGESCWIQFRFVPDAPGHYWSDYRLSYGPGSFSRVVRVTGNTPTGLVHVDRRAIDVWTVSVGEFDSRDIVITNKGSVPLRVLSYSTNLDTGFVTLTNCLNNELLSGDICTVTIQSQRNHPGSYDWRGVFNTDSFVHTRVVISATQTVPDLLEREAPGGSGPDQSRGKPHSPAGGQLR